MDVGGWQIYIANEVRDWLDRLDEATHTRVVHAIDTLGEAGPASAVHSSTRSTAPRSPTSKS